MAPLATVLTVAKGRFFCSECVANYFDIDINIL
jgi:hypothetical protein